MVRTLAAGCLLLAGIAAAQSVSAGYADRDIHYDPEQQDGIPVISSRSLAPTIRQRYDQNAAGGDFELAAADSLRPPSSSSSSSPSSSERRNSDADLDDGLDDEDEADERDEYRSASNHHDTYENPAFGESRRAAKDGDDIEHFFDQHLGPQDAIENREDNEIPINETPLRSSSAGAGLGSDRPSEEEEDDDQYAAAASGPIATIISSIINRRPIVITATTGDPADSKAAASSTDEKQTSTSLDESAGEASSLGAGPQPLALFAPMTASSSTNAYDEQELDHYGPTRETIYVSRRPGNQQRYQLYRTMAQHSGPMIQQQQLSSSSNAHQFRGQRGRPMRQQQQQQYYPVAASQAYQRNRPQPTAAADDDDDQTVSYNLSFGGSSALAADEAAAGDDAADDQAAAIEEPAYDKRPLAGYSSMRSYSPMMMMVTPAEQQRYYQQQQDPPSGMRGGARYHKDPSESVSHQYVQYRSSSKQSPTPLVSQQHQQQQQLQDTKAKDQLRDQLLASLSEQIKANPNYWQQTASSTRATNSAAPEASVGAKRLASPGSDVDTYSSFHSEIGPHKSRTTTSQLITGGVEGAQAPALIRAEGLVYPDSLNGSLKAAYSVGDLLRNNNKPQSTADSEQQQQHQASANSRVRRDDSEERDSDDADDADGVWVDDDDDDNRQQSSDLNETAQDPNDADDSDDEAGGHLDAQQEDSNEHGAAIDPPGPTVGGGYANGRVGPHAPMHGYEISPDDLMVYPPSVM